MQNKPNLLNAQINVSSFITKDYENVHLLGRRKNKAKQTQFQTFCWGCRTEKIMFCNRLNGKCQLQIAGDFGGKIRVGQRKRLSYHSRSRLPGRQVYRVRSASIAVLHRNRE